MDGDAVARNRALLLSTLGVLLQDVGRSADALPVLREAVDSMATVAGPESIPTARVQLSLTSVLLSTGRHEDGLMISSPLISTLTEKLEPKHRVTLDAAEKIARARYSLTPDAEHLTQWRRELEETKEMTHEASLEF